jgi:AraC-like DNA-binding protein
MKQEPEYDSIIPPGRTVEQIDALNAKVYNPLDIGPGRVVELRDLAAATVEVLGAFHLVQRGRKRLIKDGRTTSYSMIYLPLRGLIEWRSGARSWTVGPGQAIVIGRDQPQGAVSLEDEFEVISIHAHIGLAGGVPDRAVFKEMVHDLPGTGQFWHEKLDTAVTLWREPAFAEVVSNIIRLLLIDLVAHGAEMLPHQRATDPRIKKAMDIIQKHLDNPQVLYEVCRITKLSQSRLRYLFNRELNISPKAYHQNTRLRAVLRLLRQPDLSLKEIAAQLGYSNQQHLEKDFKRDFGVAPGRYRERM